MKLSIIIPVYNEKDTIELLLNKVIAVELPLGIEKEIVIVDDFSTDGTKDKLKKLENKYKIIFHNANKGKGSAIKSGLKNSNGEIIIIQDADLEYDPREYKKLLQPIINKEVEVVYGSRFLKKHYPRYKLFYFGNKFLSLLFSLLYNRKISDVETCYKVFCRKVLKNINIKSNRFDFEAEITAKIIKAGYEIKEISIDYKSRSFSDGKKICWYDGVIAIYTILKYRFLN